MTKQERFFLYLLEHYADFKGKQAGEVLASWESLGIDQDILDMYEYYHSEAIENAFADIDAMVGERLERVAAAPLSTDKIRGD